MFCFPLATEFGLYVVYFLDYIIGCAWWILILYLIQLFAVFVIRGKPYSSENIVRVFFDPKRTLCASVAGPLLAFMWNVVSSTM